MALYVYGEEGSRSYAERRFQREVLRELIDKGIYMSLSEILAHSDAKCYGEIYGRLMELIERSEDCEVLKEVVDTLIREDELCITKKLGMEGIDRMLKNIPVKTASGKVKKLEDVHFLPQDIVERLPDKAKDYVVDPRCAEVFKKLVERWPRIPPCRDLRREVLNCLERREDCRESLRGVLEKILKEHPEDLSTIFEMYCLLGREEFEKVLRQHPEYLERIGIKFRVDPLDNSSLSGFEKPSELLLPSILEPDDHDLLDVLSETKEKINDLRSGPGLNDEENKIVSNFEEFSKGIKFVDADHYGITPSIDPETRKSWKEMLLLFGADTKIKEILRYSVPDQYREFRDGILRDLALAIALIYIKKVKGFEIEKVDKEHRVLVAKTQDNKRVCIGIEGYLLEAPNTLIPRYNALAYCNGITILLTIIIENLLGRKGKPIIYEVTSDKRVTVSITLKQLQERERTSEASPSY